MMCMTKGTVGQTRASKRRRPQGDGSVYFDTDRQRWVGHTWINGRRRRVTAKTRAEAASRLGRLQHGDETERHADRKLTVGRLLTNWQDGALSRRSLAPSTIEAHAWAAKMLTEELGSIRLAALT